MAFDTIDINNLNIGSPFVGDALLFPNALREPGILSAHKGHFGQGSTVIPFTAALVAGPSLTSPLTWNFLGLGVETGIRNQLGSDIKIGSDISMGALKVTYNALFNKITGKEAAVTPAKTDVAPVETCIAMKGSLLGFWTYNFSNICAPCPSDRKAKTNIVPLEGSLNKILKLQGVSFDWNKDVVPAKAKTQKSSVGLIAQEVEEVIPEAVVTEKIEGNDLHTVQYENLVGVLIEGIKEQQTHIEKLQKRISVLESKISKE